MEDNTSHKTENIVKEAFQKRHSMPAHRKAQLDRLIVNKINEVKQEEEISEFYHEEIAAIEAEANSAGLAFGKIFQTMAAMATMAMLLGIVLLITFVNIDFLKTEEISVTEFASSLRVEPIAFSDSGVDVNSEFILETDSKVKLTAEEIEKNIVITPEIDFSVVAQDNSYAIVPLEELEENTHYQITLPQGTEIAGTVITDALVWEFTTEEGLQILGLDLVVTDDYGDVLIADLNFNDIDLDSIENNFLTMPLIDVKEFVAEDNKLIIIPEDASDLYQPVDIAFDKGIKDKSGKNLADLFIFSLNGDLNTPDDIARVEFVDSFDTDTINVINTSDSIDFKVLPFNDIDGNIVSGEPNVSLYEINEENLDDAAFLMMRWNAIFSKLAQLPGELISEVDAVQINKNDSGNYSLNFNDDFEMQGSHLLVIEYEEETIWVYVTDTAFDLEVEESAKSFQTNVITESNLLADIDTDGDDEFNLPDGTIVYVYYFNEQDEYAVTRLRDLDKGDVEAILGAVVEDENGNRWFVFGDMVALDFGISEQQLQEEINDIEHVDPNEELGVEQDQ